ncbi:MAG: hypothetical protein R3C01_13050 [Planctomycetaceae bacterium]
MAGWLSRLALPGGGASDAPQPFQITCECGLDHSGLRRKTSQQLVCRNCGAALFVLPKNVYPAPGEPKYKKPKPIERDEYVPGSLDDLEDDTTNFDDPSNTEPKSKSSSRQQDDSSPRPDADSSDDESSTQPSGRRMSRHQRRRQKEQRGEKSSVKGAGLSKKVGGKVASVATAGGAAAKGLLDRIGDIALMLGRMLTQGALAIIHWWTPLRLVALALVVTIVSLVAWMVHRNHVEHALSVLRPSAEAGLVAFEKGDLKEAEEKLLVAVKALDLLEQDDLFARQTRQAYREATASHGLLWGDVLSILDDAEAATEVAAKERKIAAQQPREPGEEFNPPPLDEKWRSRFSGLHQGRWVLFESPIVEQQVTDRQESTGTLMTDRGGRFRVEVGFAVGKKPRRVEVWADLPDFNRLTPEQRSQSVIFAGQLSRCELSFDESTWIIELDPQSSFLWAGTDTYRRLVPGFDEWHPAEPVEATLKQQAALLQVDSRTLPASPGNEVGATK